MESMTLKWMYGEEAICPACKRTNACIRTGGGYDVAVHECRDCNSIFVHDVKEEKVVGKDETLGRNIVQVLAMKIERTLGKNCYRCHSFNIKHKNGPSGYGWYCDDCNLFWGN